jgi:hypothetical protein
MIFSRRQPPKPPETTGKHADAPAEGPCASLKGRSGTTKAALHIAMGRVAVDKGGIDPKKRAVGMKNGRFTMHEGHFTK